MTTPGAASPTAPGGVLCAGTSGVGADALRPGSGCLVGGDPAVVVGQRGREDGLPACDGLVEDLDVEGGGGAELEHLDAFVARGVGVGGVRLDEEALAGRQCPAAHLQL